MNSKKSLSLMLMSLILCGVSLSSCNDSSDNTDSDDTGSSTNESVKGEKVWLNGFISDASNRAYKLSYTTEYLTGKDTVLEKDSLKDDNSFSVELYLEQPQKFRLVNGENYVYLYLSPGDSLSLKLTDSSTTFEGKGSEVNNYLAQKVEMSLGVREEIQLLHGRDEKEFLMGLDSLLTARKDFLYSFEIPDDKFIELEEQNLQYSYGNSVMKYQGYHEYAMAMKGKEASGEGMPVSKDFEGKMKSLYTPVVAHLDNPFYVQMVESMVNYFMTGKSEEELDEWDEKVAFMMEVLKDEKVAEFFLAKELYENVKYYGLDEDNLKLIDAYKMKYPSGNYVKNIDAILGEWEHLKAGKPAPLFAYSDVNGKVVDLKEDLRGKYVYIDVWATWCGPCMQEAPHFQKLTEKFAGKDVAFLGVSVDDDEEAWMKYLKKKEPTSIQVHADKAWDSKIANDYNINSIPRFILIDKEGRIINASASRPTEDIEAQLEELLNEEV